METSCWCPSGHQYGGRKLTDTSVVEFCYYIEKRNVFTPGPRHITINILSNARTVQVAKAYRIGHLLTYTTALFGRLFHVTQQKSLHLVQNEESVELTL